MIPIFADTNIDPKRIAFAANRREREQRLEAFINYEAIEEEDILKDFDFMDIVLQMTHGDIANVLERYSSDELARFLHALAIQEWVRRQTNE